jgi:hypothetical protein
MTKSLVDIAAQFIVETVGDKSDTWASIADRAHAEAQKHPRDTYNHNSRDTSLGRHY